MKNEITLQELKLALNFGNKLWVRLVSAFATLNQMKHEGLETADDWKGAVEGLVDGIELSMKAPQMKELCDNINSLMDKHDLKRSTLDEE